MAEEEGSLNQRSLKGIAKRIFILELDSLGKYQISGRGIIQSELHF